MSGRRINPVNTPYFHAMPGQNGSKPRHAITTHLEGWSALLRYSAKDPSLWGQFVDMYPRFVLHRDVKALNEVVLKCARTSDRTVLLFPSRQVASECIGYVTQEHRKDGKDSLLEEEIEIRVFLAGRMLLFGVIFPVQRFDNVIPFWQTTGTGISSRTAEAALEHAETIEEVFPDHHTSRDSQDQSMLALRTRIASLIDRVPVTPRPDTNIEDVYLFQTGMAAVFHVHNILRKARGDLETIQFGVPFHQTRFIFKYWGPGLRFFPITTELDALEEYISTHPISAIWSEMPLNPVLVSPDLPTLGRIARKHNIPLIVDDTVGSFANVDVLPSVDILVTSLTKSFSGYADVMGGSAVLNTASPRYPELKPLFTANYHNDLFPADAAVLFSNNADYLARCTLLNSNAETLVTYLHSLIPNPTSAVSSVLYPTVLPSLPSYNAVKRPTTPDFAPGYGCLLVVDFYTLEQAIAFYDNLHFHQGPHFGAHRTICLGYAKLAYGDDLPEAEAWGVRESQIRVSVGLEEPEVLVERLRWALGFADKLVRR